MHRQKRSRRPWLWNAIAAELVEGLRRTRGTIRIGMGGVALGTTFEAPSLASRGADVGLSLRLRGADADRRRIITGLYDDAGHCRGV